MDDNIYTYRGYTMSNDKASPTPLDSPLVKKDKYHQDIERARDEGFQEGVKKGHLDVIDWLEKKYLAEDAPDRGTPEAQAILTLAREGADHFRSMDYRVGNGKKGRKAR